MTLFNATFTALLKEAEFTKEMLGSGATQLRKANYASKGTYFLAFTSLSTGFERIGKLCLMLDHYWTTGGQFPDINHMRKSIGHKLLFLYEKSQEILKERSLKLDYLQNLSGPIHQAILHTLHNFAEGDRYSNINLLLGNPKGSGDPIARWFDEVDLALYQAAVSDKRKRLIERNAAGASSQTAKYTLVHHISETGSEITDVRDAIYRTAVYKAVAPYRQLYILQIIRYWVEVLCKLEHVGGGTKSEDIPFFSELFGTFRCADKDFQSRKTWEGV